MDVRVRVGIMLVGVEVNLREVTPVLVAARIVMGVVHGTAQRVTAIGIAFI